MILLEKILLLKSILFFKAPPDELLSENESKQYDLSAL